MGLSKHNLLTWWKCPCNLFTHLTSLRVYGLSQSSITSTSSKFQQEKIPIQQSSIYYVSKTGTGGGRSIAREREKEIYCSAKTRNIKLLSIDKQKKYFGWSMRQCRLRDPGMTKYSVSTGPPRVQWLYMVVTRIIITIIPILCCIYFNWDLAYVRTTYSKAAGYPSKCCNQFCAGLEEHLKQLMISWRWMLYCGCGYGYRFNRLWSQWRSVPKCRLCIICSVSYLWTSVSLAL